MNSTSAQPQELSLVLESWPDPCLLLSPELTVCSASKTFLSATQTAKENLLGQSARKAFPPLLSVAEVWRLLELVLETNTIQLTSPIPCGIQPGSNEQPHYWRAAITPVPDEQGNLLYIILRFSEVNEFTSRKDPALLQEESSESHPTKPGNQPAKGNWQASQQPEQMREENESPLRDMFEQTAVGIVLTDLDLKPTYVNEPYCKLLGRSRQEVLTLNMKDITHPEDLDGNLEQLRKAKETGAPFVIEKRYFKPDGSTVWIVNNVSLIRNQQGVPLYYMGVCQEITARKQAEEALRQSEAHFSLVIDSVPQSLWITDEQGRAEFLNQHWWDYAGVPVECTTAAEIAGKFTHPEDGPKVMAAFTQAMQTGKPFEVEQRNRSAAGEYRWFLNRGNPYRDPATGQITKWIGVGIDIHDRKLAEEALRQSEERLQKALSIQTVGVIFFDLAGGINDSNQAFSRMSGYSKEDFVSGKVRWDKLTPPEFMEVTLKSREELLTQGQNTPYEKQYIRPDGSRWWGLFSGKRLSEGECVEFVIDISGRKLAEQHLQRLTEELATANAGLSVANEEIQTRNEELFQANRHLSRVNADLDNFIYTASHDLKTPILNIEGLQKVLFRRILNTTGQDEQLEKLFEMIQDSVNRFKETITDLTDIARIQKQTDQESERVDLLEILESTLLDLQQQVVESGARIEKRLEDCPVIVFPRKNLKSILYNLISNAIKYREPSRNPHIILSCAPQGEYLALQVRDNGLGMDTGDESKIFGMFKRLHSHVEGTGVGLYIVKKMIENEGGKITVESTVGEGSAFKVYFKA